LREAKMSAESEFYERAEGLIGEILERNPVWATLAGEHRYDKSLADRSPEGLAADLRALKTALDIFGEMDTSGLGPDALIDHTLIVQILKSMVREQEKMQGFKRDPGQYVGEIMDGASILVMKEFAPLEDRLVSVRARLGQAERVLEEARTNLAAADIPPVWLEVALEQTKQAPGLFLELLPRMAAKEAPALESDLRRTGKKVVEVLQDFTDFLENRIGPEARGDFAVGEDLFNELLRENHMVDYRADELLETGHRLFRETEEAMQSVAAEIDPDRSVKEILEEAKENHPTEEGLIAAYREAMESARRYVIEHEIATVPAGETLRLVETPVYLRPILPFAAYMPPGILEKKQEGMFLVTPVDPDAPEDIRRQQLRGHNLAKLPVTALHEAYPGHHLQLVWANRTESIPRRMGSFLSTLFIEGWAFYCEELMEELGYISEPTQRLGRLNDQLWRAARIILDVSIHTRGMSVEEAVAMLVDRCGLERSNALAEVRRYTGSPTQPQSYLMGKLAILDLVKDYRREHPGVSLKQMHDDILACGSLPPKLMRKRLIGGRHNGS
jgi:uncharacterized protein (DUF885 family)